MNRLMNLLFVSGWLCLMTSVHVAGATTLQVTVENLQPGGGYYFTPVWLGLHDGSFDLFNLSSPASSQLEAIAEEGNVAPLASLFGSGINSNGSSRQGMVMMSPGGFAGAPVFDPGEVVTQLIDVTDPASNRYVSFASMVIPSNDAFFGNDDPLRHMLFQPDGSFAGPLTIDIPGDRLYDAGTELNNNMGAAFSAIGGVGTTEGGLVSMPVNLDSFLNTQTVAGTGITQALGSLPLARIHISAVPEPSSLSLLGLGLPWFIRRHCLRPLRNAR